MNVKIPKEYRGLLYFYVISHEGNLAQQQTTSLERFEKYLKLDQNSKPNPEFFYEFRGVNEQLLDEIKKILSSYNGNNAKKIGLKLTAKLDQLAEKSEEEGLEGLLSGVS